jgi:hypothetical protein
MVVLASAYHGDRPEKMGTFLKKCLKYEKIVGQAGLVFLRYATAQGLFQSNDQT